MATVIPKSLNLAAVKPTTIPAYSRRVESIATNAQTFTENGIANIVLDTSTPGSFLDPTQSLLQFDVTITNTNPYIDYINLSSSGMAAIIQEMRIICQGTPIEEMLDYNMMFEMFMDMGGHAQEEFKMYMENSWRAPVAPGISDLNFVKPPMVDREGMIMCPDMVNMFGDSNTFSIHNEDGPTLINATESAQTGISAVSTNMAAGQYNTGVNYLTAGSQGYYTVSGQTIQRGPTSTITPAGTALVNANAGNAAGNNGGNYIHAYDPGANNNLSTCTAGGNIRSQAWTNRIDNTYVTWPSTIRPEPFIKNEARMRHEADSKRYRVQDYIDFLANVKNIPVGCTPVASFIAKDISKIDGALMRPSYLTAKTQDGGETLNANWNFAALAGLFTPGTGTYNHTNYAQGGTGTPTNTTFSVSLPIFSGILGVWAEKQFPSMLISPGSFYIQVKFAKAQQAFQCAMDPCRRLIGTYRDYVPNCGLPNYYATEYRGQVLNAAKTGLYQADGAFNYCNGTNNTFMALTTAGTTGNDFAWQGILGLYAPAAATAPGTALTLDSAAGNKNGYRNNIMADARDATVLAGNTNAAGLTDILGQGEGYTTGNPKPQYVPRAVPWTMAGNGFNAAATLIVGGAAGSSYVRERHVCYGTYLPFSTAQVRRTRAAYNKIGTHSNQAVYGALNSNYDAYPTYAVTNLRYVGVQTILPDEVTASIVRTAASSDISLHAQSCRTYRTVMSQSLTQNLILPVKVASANSMWVIFQNQNMIENTHYCSLTRICPFSSFQWTQDPYAKAVGSDAVPNIKTVGTIQPFQIQLRIGNELLPQQPMTSVPQIVTELQRSVHALNDMDTNLCFYGSLRSVRATSNISSQNVITSEYSSFKSGDFCVPYIPIDALDDQTITNNPLFMDYHNAWAAANAAQTNYATTWNSSTSSTFFNDRGTYIYPDFLPPVSKFLLGFDLDTFPGTNETARSGRYLGNAPLTLQMTNTVASVTPSIASGTQDSLIATAIVLHDIRFSIMAGGQVLAYY